ncbi:MAG: redoxin domain-containing protein [candidate division NC10 bacterium]|nr:redoxin domain-containing protein [candidate division NC10 bacterium]MBI2164195.1 redoxin domain-containing protein [candidate division NC10 bacterium]MBI2458602.1 redoxin domain-containing protein [candidate division NC10 bacterium]MBI2561599.1 redoxin domain-containing protein [candidate division NC10 bacterium]MBI3086163.1 redoxin domain-containing protein [candidate division NC10 bacterium]
MPALEARRNDFEAAGAVILGISIDSVYSHDAWARHHGLSYPLLSDIHRTACQAYGIHNAERNCARRATFIVDKASVVRFKEEYGPGQLPDPDRLLQVVRTLGP